MSENKQTSNPLTFPSGRTTLKQRRGRYINVEAMLFQLCVPAGVSLSRLISRRQISDIFSLLLPENRTLYFRI